MLKVNALSIIINTSILVIFLPRTNTRCTLYIDIGTLFAESTKTVLSLHMHRYLSAINRNSNGKSYVPKKEVYHGTLEFFSYLFSNFVYS